MQCEHVVVINDFSTSNGGASAIAFENAIQLDKLGVKVTFISADGAQNPLQASHGIACITIKGKALDPDKPLQGMIHGLHNFKAQQFMQQWIAQHDTPQTIYHVHCWSKVFTPSLFKALKPIADRLVIHGHDYFPACPNGAFIHYPSNSDCNLTPGSVSCLKSQCDQRSYTHKLWRFGRHFLREHWIDFSKTRAKMVLLNETMHAYFSRADFADHNLTLIANPVTPYADKRVASESHDTFVYVGRVVPEKGVDTFLEAVLKTNLPAKVIGDGESLNKFKQAYPQVTFTGWQDQPSIVKELQTARAVVMPSKLRETFGLVSVEAVASGLPVIVSDKSPLAALLTSLKMGLSVNPENADDIAEKMQRIANDDSLTHEMSVNGHEDWRKIAYEPAAWGEALLSLYQEMLNTN